METLSEIKAAISHLTFDEKAELAKWFHGWQDDDWDRQMAADAASGRFDRLLGEVDKSIEEYERTI
jgi:hypothetical protein